MNNKAIALRSRLPYSSVRRFFGSWRQDMKLQFRHHFYSAYLLISIAYIILLRMLPDTYQADLNVLLTFSDPSMLGFFFIGGLILLEKGQHIHDNLFVTPYSPASYIWSKTLSLTCLSLISSLFIHMSTFGIHQRIGVFIAGVALTAVFFTLVGLGVAVRCHTVNGFFFSSVLYSTILVLPVLETMQVYSSKLFLLFPATGSLLLLTSVFKPISGADTSYAIACLLIWIGIAFYWAHSSMQSFLFGHPKRGTHA
ncbi:ABC transporter permease [Paenibacillus apiarius]|uniref:fluoroquinolone export ABC transporter permease subunit n=1 Tax=Paenibacillus apiarius TaxID=46240 RepID=UPI00197F3A5C|nr:ABC transporter permease [Paenibacillus apiarius]MBN3522454.1 ABC transporter permease [Paenibacillus apiarius]